MSRTRKTLPIRLFRRDSGEDRRRTNNEVRESNRQLTRRVIRGETDADNAVWAPSPTTEGRETW